MGGTKTDLAVVSPARGARRPLAKRRYSSVAHVSLAEMARSFLDDVNMKVAAACFAVAGPVIQGEAELTNLAWHIDESSLAALLGVERAWLLNDLVAIASAIPLLPPDELYPIKEVESQPGGTVAVLAPGTGLGEAFLTRDRLGYTAHVSEGGHVAFAPSSELEVELLRTLWRRFDHVSVERVASGVGIPNLYDFLRDEQGMAEAPGLASRMAETEDRTHAILQAALDQANPDPLATATLSLFLRILGAEAANLALKVLATGGVYLAGGIAEAVREELRKSPFLEAFTHAGRFSRLLDRVPVYLAMGQVALLGAANEGLKLLATSAAGEAVDAH